MIVGYSKLFSDIIHSTVWREEMHVKVVWITMLAMADRHGQVMSSIPGLADSAKVTLEQCLDALEIFKSPDEYSRTKDYEGRRIIDVEGGWLILNYEKFRARKDDEEQRQRTKERVRRHRERQKEVTDGVTVTPCNPIAESESESDTKTDTEAAPPPKQKKGTRIPNDFSVTEKMTSWFIGKKFTFSEPTETEKFVNYWTSKAGQSAVKLDWFATWRTWMLNAQDYKGGFPAVKPLTPKEEEIRKGTEEVRRAREMAYVPRNS